MKQFFAAAAATACILAASSARADDAPYTRAVVTSVEQVEARIAHLLSVARRERDSVRVVCSSDALSRADAAVRRAQNDAQAWSKARATGDATGARSALVRLQGDHDAAERASHDVDACFDVGRGKDDRTIVVVRVDAD